MPEESNPNNLNFTILVGGKVPAPPRPVDPNNPVPANIDQINKQLAMNLDFTKWETCKWKSGVEQVTVKGCCGAAPSSTFMISCRRLTISNLLPVVCTRCNFYQNKNESTN